MLKSFVNFNFFINFGKNENPKYVENSGVFQHFEINRKIQKRARHIRKNLTVLAEVTKLFFKVGKGVLNDD